MSVLGALKDIKGIIRGKKDDSAADISNLTLNLFRFTSFILMGFSGLCTTKSFFGDPIHCEPVIGVDDAVFKNFCWITGSYVTPKRINEEGRIHRYGFKVEQVTEKRYQNYYQWIPFIFFFQALLLYLPYMYWKRMENGKIQSLIKIGELGNGKNDDSDDPDTQSVRNLGKILIKRQGSYNWYTVKFIVSHLMAILVLISLLYTMDLMLEGDFRNLGSTLAQLSTLHEDYYDFKSNPLLRVFPKLIQCNFDGKIGPSGSQESHNAICILPINVLNEKIFVFLWFWYVILFVWTLINSILNVILIVCSLPRVFILRYFVDSTRRTSAYSFERLVQSADFGDWFILMLLKKNLDGTTFCLLLNEMASQTSNNFNNQLLSSNQFSDFSPMIERNGNRRDTINTNNNSLQPSIHPQSNIGLVNASSGPSGDQENPGSTATLNKISRV